MPFVGDDLESSRRDGLSEVCRPEDVDMGRFADQPHHRKGKPDRGVHLTDAGCLGDEEPAGSGQGTDVTERAGQITLRSPMVVLDRLIG